MKVISSAKRIISLRQYYKEDDFFSNLIAEFGNRPTAIAMRIGDEAPTWGLPA